MFLGAMLDLMDPSQIKIWEERMQTLFEEEAGAHYTLKTTTKGGIEGAKLDFFVGTIHSDEHNAHFHRHYTDVCKLLEKLHTENCLSERSYFLASKIFFVLAAAEAVAHECTVAEVYFHEVGAFDSIADIVGFALAEELLSNGEETFFKSSYVGIGSGEVNTAHGILNIPTPATKEIIVSYNIEGSNEELVGERLTPTGAAILASIVDCYQVEVMSDHEKIGRVGIGCGTKDFSDRPNILKIIEL